MTCLRYRVNERDISRVQQFSKVTRKSMPSASRTDVQTTCKSMSRMWPTSCFESLSLGIKPLYLTAAASREASHKNQWTANRKMLGCRPLSSQTGEHILASVFQVHLSTLEVLESGCGCPKPS
ncbi:hypothetical protein PISMIDRAFT_537728 [Pisolithus microcarpus 441]|uniref:Uncharacterized protein n=1 Tax=Pisolithus microcarpus 441 TaxID=765257 RepID=A0A0C9YA89_9AGAM|nr:hypothetical protein PISMIDRAFT_537728 [Pisolithus microcarpus 441]